MNDKADRLKAALRENLKRRKAHMRDRTVSRDAGEKEAAGKVAAHNETGTGKEADRS